MPKSGFLRSETMGLSSVSGLWIFGRPQNRAIDESGGFNLFKLTD